MENSEDPDQLAALGSALFSKEDASSFSMTWDNTSRTHIKDSNDLYLTILHLFSDNDLKNGFNLAICSDSD